LVESLCYCLWSESTKKKVEETKKHEEQLMLHVTAQYFQTCSWREEFCRRMQKSVLRCQITFTIRYNTYPGQIMCVIGNVEPLGVWDLKKAKQMEYVGTSTSREDEPNWKLIVSVPVGLHRQFIKMEYKFVVVDDNLNAHRWETMTRRKDIFRGESVYYFRNYWNCEGYEYASGYRHQYWSRTNQQWKVNLCRAVASNA